jgi:alkaline phosphatase
MIWGPDSFTDVAGGTDGYYDDGIDIFNGWEHVVNNGKGEIPGVQYASGGHTNALVPVFAKGIGSFRLFAMIDGIDFKAAKFWRFNGLYIDNTDIFDAMESAMLGFNTSILHQKGLEK